MADPEERPLTNIVLEELDLNASDEDDIDQHTASQSLPTLILQQLPEEYTEPFTDQINSPSLDCSKCLIQQCFR
jgi:hypothetical protein